MAFPRAGKVIFLIQHNFYYLGYGAQHQEVREKAHSSLCSLLKCIAEFPLFAFGLRLILLRP